MESKAKVLGHPIHQMLVVFPLGLLATSVVFDWIAVWRGNPEFFQAAFYMIGAGVIGGLLAALFGLIDWLAVPAGTRAHGIGAWHGVGNVIVVLLFAASWILRWDAPASPDDLAKALSLIGLALALITGWLGGELMDRMGVGIDEGANLNAPSSLSGGSHGAHGSPEGYRA